MVIYVLQPANLSILPPSQNFSALSLSLTFLKTWVTTLVALEYPDNQIY